MHRGAVLLNPSPARDVTIEGDATSTAALVSGVEYSLDSGANWNAVDEPAGGWGRHSVHWSQRLAVYEGARAGTGLGLFGADCTISSAESVLTFVVDTTPPETVSTAPE